MENIDGRKEERARSLIISETKATVKSYFKKPSPFGGREGTQQCGTWRAKMKQSRGA